MYTPSKKILDKYANILVNFALGSGKGIKKGEVIFLQVPECAKPILISLRNAVLTSGGIPIIEYYPDDMVRDYYDLADNSQLEYFPAKYLKGKVEEMDHVISIIAETNKHELEGIDPKKIMMKQKSVKPYIDWRRKKESDGKHTWTLALYGTPAMAKESGMTLEEYWDQIIKACYLNETNPVNKWKQIFNEVERVRTKLNSLNIKSMRIKAGGTDLTIGIDKNRKWLGGSGRNIPSFEVFISPDWRKTEGIISFNQPLYRYGAEIRDVELKFKNGKVVLASASKGEKILNEMIKVENADKVGEFSLTDSRLSKITKFMGETLFDENMGGKYGNTHIALGSAYRDSYKGKVSAVKKEKWQSMGFNDSSVHTDIVSTFDRVVTAKLTSGKEIVIYEKGKFVI